MEILVSILIQSICLFIAAKLLSVQLNIITSIIVIGVATIVSMAIPGLLALPIALLVYAGLIKKFDSNCDYLKIVGLFVVGIAAQQFLYEQIIFPMLFSTWA